MIARRAFLASAATIALPGSARAQAVSPPPLIGWLRAGAAEPVPGKPLRDPLAARGLVDGRDYRLVMRFSEGRNERFAELAEQLVRDGAAVIVPFGNEATRAAQAATKTVPIVAVAELVGGGFVASMPRPGGNITGVTMEGQALDLKKFEVLKELLPETKRVAYMVDSTNWTGDISKPIDTARALGMALTPVEIAGAADIESAFRAFAEAGSTAVNIGNSPLLAQFRPRIGELSRQHRIPAICQWREMVESGCLASYGFTLGEMFDLVADYIERVLKRAKPADLPVVTPKRFELVINLKVARELGVAIPPAMLQRADEVIE